MMWVFKALELVVESAHESVLVSGDVEVDAEFVQLERRR